MDLRLGPHRLERLMKKFPGMRPADMARELMHVAAQRFAMQTLENPDMTRSLNTLKNLEKHRVRTAFERWIDRNMQKKSANALWSLINVRGASDFRMHIYRAISWLRRNIGKKPYALLVEVNGTVDDRFTVKSSLWLSAALLRSFRSTIRQPVPPPAMIIPLVGDDVQISPVLLDEALYSGISTFVHIDDSVYSGLQKASIIEQFAKTLKRTNRYRISPVPHLFIATAYSSAYGKVVIKKAAATYRHYVDAYYFASHLLTRKKINDAAILHNLRVHGANIGTAPLSTIMPHKIPNNVSFAPANFGLELERTVLRKPHYKKKKYTRPIERFLLNEVANV